LAQYIPRQATVIVARIVTQISFFNIQMITQRIPTSIASTVYVSVRSFPPTLTVACVGTAATPLADCACMQSTVVAVVAAQPPVCQCPLLSPMGGDLVLSLSTRVCRSGEGDLGTGFDAAAFCSAVTVVSSLRAVVLVPRLAISCINCANCWSGFCVAASIAAAFRPVVYGFLLQV
jgi:hypothetical protein